MTLAQVNKGLAPRLFRTLVGRAPRASFADATLMRRLHRLFGSSTEDAIVRALENQSAKAASVAGAAPVASAARATEPVTYPRAYNVCSAPEVGDQRTC